MTDVNRSALVAALAACVVCAGCGDGKTTSVAFGGTNQRPDSYPVMLNEQLPFRYPPALYAEKVQANVTLRLYVDSSGAVVNDSTRIVESSKVDALDSAAVRGSRELRFSPAKRGDAAMPVSILFPVYFRHPEAPPPPGDSIFKKVPLPGSDSVRKG
jgi:TonB family protein